MRPPRLAATSLASTQPETAPATVSAAVGPARRQRVVASFAIALDGGERTGRAAGVDDARRPARLGDEEEGVAADPVHVRIDDGDGRRRGDHRLDRVAAGPQHLGRRPPPPPGAARPTIPFSPTTVSLMPLLS